MCSSDLLVSVIGSGQQKNRRAELIPVAPSESVPCLLSPACSPRFPGSSRLGLFVFPAYFARPSTTNNHKQGIKSSVPKKLYYASTYPTLIWYVLPFVKQPRIHGIYDWIDGDFNIPGSVYIIITLSVFVYFFIF